MTTNRLSPSPSEAEGRFQKRDVLVSLLFAVPTFLLVLHFADPGRARAAALCIGVDVIVVKARWALRRTLSFWFATSLMLAVQAIMIGIVNFTDVSLPAAGLLPAGLAVYLFDEAIMRILTKRS